MKHAIPVQLALIAASLILVVFLALRSNPPVEEPTVIYVETGDGIEAIRPSLTPRPARDSATAGAPDDADMEGEETPGESPESAANEQERRSRAGLRAVEDTRPPDRITIGLDEEDPTNAPLETNYNATETVY